MKVDKDNCICCMICEEVCEFGAISVDMSSNNKYKGAAIDEDICTNCGACIEVCSGECIHIS